MWFAKLKSLGIAFGSKAVDNRSAGIRQAHHLGALIKCFACRIVDGLTQHFHIVGRINLDNLRIAARNEQAQIRKLRHFGVFVFFHKVSEHVSVQVVNIEQWYSQRQGQALGKRGAHEQRPHKSGSACKCYCADVVFSNAGLADGFRNHRNYVLLMRTRCQFGYYPAICLMHLLACYHIRHQHAILDDCRRCIVARRLYSKYYYTHNILYIMCFVFKCCQNISNRNPAVSVSISIELKNP